MSSSADEGKDYPSHKDNREIYNLTFISHIYSFIHDVWYVQVKGFFSPKDFINDKWLVNKSSNLGIPSCSPKGFMKDLIMWQLDSYLDTHICYIFIWTNWNFSRRQIRLPMLGNLDGLDNASLSKWQYEKKFTWFLNIKSLIIRKALQLCMNVSFLLICVIILP